jgi:hypothetical protein
LIISLKTLDFPSLLWYAKLVLVKLCFWHFREFPPFCDSLLVYH